MGAAAQGGGACSRAPARHAQRGDCQGPWCVDCEAVWGHLLDKAHVMRAQQLAGGMSPACGRQGPATCGPSRVQSSTGCSGMRPGTPRLGPAGSVEEWERWLAASKAGLRRPLGQDLLKRRYWAFGGAASAWRIYVEDDSEGALWGYYDGAPSPGQRSLCCLRCCVVLSLARAEQFWGLGINGSLPSPCMGENHLHQPSLLRWCSAAAAQR